MIITHRHTPGCIACRPALSAVNFVYHVVISQTFVIMYFSNCTSILPLFIPTLYQLCRWFIGKKIAGLKTEITVSETSMTNWEEIFYYCGQHWHILSVRLVFLNQHLHQQFVKLHARPSR